VGWRQTRALPGGGREDEEGESPMRLTVINASNTLTNDDIFEVLRAINRQLRDDFGPTWKINCTVSFVSGSGTTPDPEIASGDGAIFVCDTPDGQDAGYHAQNEHSIPFGYVFTEAAAADNQAWSAVLSHEILEMAADPHLNTLKIGPDPRDDARTAGYLMEVCDPVNGSTYPLDGSFVADFVMPNFYEVGTTRKTVFHGATIKPFTHAAGGYIEFYDPKSGSKLRLGDHVGLARAKRKDELVGCYCRAARHASARFAPKPNRKKRS
jgi:hypothetical protein